MLTFKEFQQLNRRRCEEAFKHEVGDEGGQWPFTMWCLAIAGEAGELCNRVKKHVREFIADPCNVTSYDDADGHTWVNNYTPAERDEILMELADVITYCDLAISHLGADTGETLMAKFIEVNGRVGWRQPPTESLCNAIGDADREAEKRMLRDFLTVPAGTLCGSCGHPKEDHYDNRLDLSPRRSRHTGGCKCGCLAFKISAAPRR